MTYRAVVFFALILFWKPAPILGQKHLDRNTKLYATAKIWGFLKYYHPNVSGGNLDWDKELFRILNEIEHYETKQEISRLYNRWIGSLGEFKVCSKCLKGSDKKYFDGNFDLSWTHADTLFTKELSKQLKYIENNRSLEQKFYFKPVGKAGNVEPLEKKFDSFKWSDKDHRLLALFRYWNFIEYFFPYKYLIDENWDDVLVEMIPRFLTARSEFDYHLAMLELVVKLDDSHAGLDTPLLQGYFGQKYIPVVHAPVGDRIVVTGIFNDSLAKLNDLAVGDIIRAANDIPVKEIIKGMAKYFQGGNEIAKTKYGWNKIFNGSTDSVTLKIERNGSTFTRRVGRYDFEDFNYRRPEEKGWDIKNGSIGYINMAAFEVNQINDIADSLKNLKALIIDIRNYPKDFVFGYFGFLFEPGKMTFYKSLVPEVAYPGKFLWKDGDTFKFGKKEKYEGKVVILVNERTISLAEFTAMYFQASQNSITMGSQTLAADGNLSGTDLLGGYPTNVSGIGIFYPDGQQTQRKGVKIDIEVRPTVESISEGEDLVLKKAIEYINTNIE